jgi:hypothetical protein
MRWFVSELVEKTKNTAKQIKKRKGPWFQSKPFEIWLMYKTWHATKTKLNKLYFYSTEIRDKTFIETETIIEYFSILMRDSIFIMRSGVKSQINLC